MGKIQMRREGFWKAEEVSVMMRLTPQPVKTKIEGTKLCQDRRASNLGVRAESYSGGPVQAHQSHPHPVRTGLCSSPASSCPGPSFPSSFPPPSSFSCGLCTILHQPCSLFFLSFFGPRTRSRPASTNTHPAQSPRALISICQGETTGDFPAQ